MATWSPFLILVNILSAAAQKKSNKWLWLAIIFGGVALAVLLSLGTWQVQRLAWKENLLATVNARLENPPVPILDAIYGDPIEENIEYKPVLISGTYVPDEVFFEFTTYKGNSGWHVFHLLKTDPEHTRGSEFTIINRGFIPYDMRDKWQEIAALPEGPVEITGLLRIGPTSKPGSMMPDNSAAERTFYWRSLEAMAVVADLEQGSVALWYVDRGLPGQESASAEFPIPGNTIIKFSNNHLQYAVTWYGLALTLIGVLGYYVLRHRRGQQ